MRAILLKCRKFRHLCLIIYLLMISSHGVADSVGRKPANFVPDDDLIIVPMVLEKNVYDRFNERHARDFSTARKTLDRWISQEAYAEAYGLENRAVFLPTPDQKQRFFERRYMRFLSKDVERGANQTLQETLEEMTADEEIDAIRAVEMHEKVLIKAQGQKSQKRVKKTKQIKVAGQKFKFGFQPRLEIGMVKITLQSSFFNARAWLGVNGNRELYVERRFKSTKTRVFANYKIDQEEQETALASVDQSLLDNWTLRFTHNKNYSAPITDPNNGENNIIQLRFGKRF